MELRDIDLTRLASFGGDMPHHWFSFLRREAPVWFHPPVAGVPELGGEGFWVLSRYADIVAVNRDWETWSAETGPGREGGGITINDEKMGVGVIMIMMDPPRQLRLRQLVNKGFTPRMIAKIEAQTQERARRIFDAIADRGACDFVADVAAELPLQVIAEILGVPESDRHRLFTWTSRLLDARITRAEREAAGREMYSYAHALAEEKRKHPADDVLSKLVDAELTEADGSTYRLSELDVDLFFQLLATGGSETTRNAISGGLLAFLEHPGELRRLREDPGLWPQAVEEILRWTSPVNYFRRTATRDAEVGGERIRAGQKVTIWYCSANRDEAVFADPFRFDVGRSPNHHLAFGAGGPHFCLGANLARMEIRVTFEELLRRIDGIELAGEIERFHTRWDINVFGGYQRLPITFEPRSAAA